MTPSGRAVHLTAIGTGLAVFLVYLYTLAPTVTFIDAGELAAVVYTGGIAHPTGYPLYVLLAGLWAKLPIGTYIFRLNLLSAVFSSIGAVVFVHLMCFVLGKFRPVKNTDTGEESTVTETCSKWNRQLQLIMAAAGALIIAFSRTVWHSSVSVEVYSLHILLLSVNLWLFLTFLYDGNLSGSQRMTRWLLFSLLLGLSFSNHMSTVMLAPAFLVMYFVKHGLRADSFRRLLLAVPLFLTGLTPYLSIPIRASLQPHMNWSDPSTIDAFLRHITGWQFKAWMFSGIRVPLLQLEYFATIFPAEFGFVLVPFIVAGAVLSFRRNRQLAWMLLLLFAGSIAYAVNYAIYDIETYFLLAFITAGIWSAAGFYFIIERVPERFRVPGILVVLALVGLMAGSSYTASSQRDNWLVEDYTKNVFDSVDRNAIVFSDEWYTFVSASFYYQLVENVRPDVTVIDRRLLRRRWYIRQLQRNFPELMSRSGPEIESYLDEYSGYVQSGTYDPDTIRVRNLRLIKSIIDNNYGTRPIYFTARMGPEFAPGYELVPENMAIHLYLPDHVPAPETPVDDDFVYRDFSTSSSDETVGSLKGTYFIMLAKRGFWLYGKGRHDLAEKYFERAAEDYEQFVASERWKKWKDLYDLFRNRL